MKDDPMNRLKVKRGSDLPQAKLTEDDVSNILEIVRDREEMRTKLRSMTNRALAEKFEVHQRTIDKITSGLSWSHVV